MFWLKVESTLLWAIFCLRLKKNIFVLEILNNKFRYCSGNHSSEKNTYTSIISILYHSPLLCLVQQNFHSDHLIDSRSWVVSHFYILFFRLFLFILYLCLTNTNSYIFPPNILRRFNRKFSLYTY